MHSCLSVFVWAVRIEIETPERLKTPAINMQSSWLTNQTQNQKVLHLDFLVLRILKLFNLDLFFCLNMNEKLFRSFDQQGHGNKSTFAYRSSSSTRVSHAICCLNRSHWSVSFSQHENMTMHSCLSVFVWAVREGFN